MRNLIYILLALVHLGTITACSTPEEKAADFIESGKNNYDEGKFNKAVLEFKNALQINQNLVEAWYGLAQIHEKRQEWRQAYIVLKKIKELAPQHIDGRVKLGQILLASNQLDQALLDAKDLIEIAPDDARSHALMAAVQFRLNNIEGALQEVNQTLKIDPNNAEAKLVIARIKINQKKYEQAHEILDQAIKFDPKNVSIYLMKIEAFQQIQDKNGVESTYKALIKQFPDKLFYQHALAKFYINSNQTGKAEKVYSKIVADHPDSVDERILLVAFTKKYGSEDQSINLLKRYIDENDDEYRYKFVLAELYEKSDRKHDAVMVYQDIIESDQLQPNGLTARNKLALLELQQGNQENAKSLNKVVLENDKNNEDALLMRASFKMIDKLFDDAVVDLRTVLRDNPSSIKALSLIAKAYEANGSRELSLENYVKAFQLQPELPMVANQLAGLYIRTKKYSQANDVLEESLRKGNKSITALKLLAQVKLSLQEWDAAENIAELLQKIEGQESLSQQVMGIVYQGKKQQTESIDAFKKAYELSPESSQPIVALVRTYVRNGKIEAAKDFLNSVLSVHTHNVTAYTLLGQLSLYEKKPQEAEKFFKKSIQINPELVSGYRALAKIYLNEEKFDEAEKIIGKGLSALPENIALSMSLASIYEKQFNFDKAIETYKHLLLKNPELIIVKNNLASLLTDYRTDKESLDKALRISSEFRNSKIPYFRDTYAWTKVRSEKEVGEAISILKGIIDEVDGVPIFHYHLGIAYLKNGDTDDAVKQLKISMEMGGKEASFYHDANSAINSIQ